MSLPVYIIGDNPVVNPGLTEILFTDPYFNVVVPDIPPLLNSAVSQDFSAKYRIESYRILWALSDAKTRFPNLPVLIVKDTSVSNAASPTIADVTRTAINNNSFELCYLCKWLDKCQLYTEKVIPSGTTTTIAKTQSPQGVQAIVFSPHGRDVILGIVPMKNGQFFTIDQPLGQELNTEIFNGNISARCIIPNLIDFNINLATSNEDFLKTQECSQVVIPQTSQGSYSYLIFILIVIAVFIVAWAAIKLGMKPSS